MSVGAAAVFVTKLTGWESLEEPKARGSKRLHKQNAKTVILDLI
jgi:hypothetical protein